MTGKSLSQTTAAYYAEAVAHVTGVKCELLFATTRVNKRAAFARHLWLYLLNTTGGYSCTAIQRRINRDRTTVRYAVGRIEDARDCREFDRAVSSLDLYLRGHLHLVDCVPIVFSKARVKPCLVWL